MFSRVQAWLAAAVERHEQLAAAVERQLGPSQFPDPRFNVDQLAAKELEQRLDTMYNQVPVHTNF